MASRITIAAMLVCGIALGWAVSRIGTRGRHAAGDASFPDDRDIARWLGPAATRRPNAGARPRGQGQGSTFGACFHGQISTHVIADDGIVVDGDLAGGL